MSSLRNLLPELKKLEGKTLHTLSQNKPFDLVTVSCKEVVLKSQLEKTDQCLFGNSKKLWTILKSIKHLALLKLEVSKFRTFIQPTSRL